MKNFSFQNPVKIIFGKDTIQNLANELPPKARIMITFGGGSVKKNGVYQQVIDALKGFTYTEFWGIEPNPHYETLMKAVEQARREKVDYLLAVGGGSVIDGTKFIAKAIRYAGDDCWDVVMNPKAETSFVPFATVLTLAATGSEMNSGAVITRAETKEKRVMAGSFPEFSILDPQVLYSLPKFQIACGVIDSFIHVMEQYLTTPDQSMLMDRWAEGILQTLVELAPELMKEQPSYDAMANFMLSATMALNGFIKMGVDEDWGTHMIGHELTALTGLTHGVTLSIIMPRMMDVMRPGKAAKIIQYGERIWNISSGTIDERIDKAIEKTELFFNSLDIATRLSNYEVSDEVICEISNRWEQRNWNLGEQQMLNAEKVKEILERSR